MARFFHGLMRTVILTCLVVLCFGTASFAGEATPDGGGTSCATKASRRLSPGVSGIKAGRRFVRRKPYRARVRRTGKPANQATWVGKTRASKRALTARTAAKPVAVKPVAVKKAVKKAAVRPASVHITRTVDAAAAVLSSVGEATQVAEHVAYEFAGYTVTADGAPVKMWYSEHYTVKSPYAYLGRMPVGAREVHVWMETAGTLLASAVTESAAEPLPDVAQMMERFPDGGLGVVVAGWDEFAPPAEPSVEVVEFTEPSR